MTKIIKVDPVNFKEEELEEALKALENEGTVAFPTETVYGLGANAFKPNAVRKIFEAKGRPADNPLIVHIGEIEQLYEVAKKIPEWVEKAVETLWPGPVTFVLPKKKKVPDIVTAGLKTVAVRMPAHPIPLLLAKKTAPIAAPSANISGKPSPTTAKHVIEDLYGRVDVIIDAGETFFGIESTVIDATEEPPIILRPGPMTKEELEKITGKKLRVHPAALVEGETKTAKSPGMKYKHYAPDAKVILIEGTWEKIVETAKKLYEEYTEKGYKTALLVSKETAEKLGENYEHIIIGERKNLYTVAKNLYKSLRKLDEKQYEIAITEGYPPKGIGLAITNRLRKAAQKTIKLDGALENDNK